ncbi:hypothetical protein Tco_0874766 [Tanacetum coccineum]|uniref:Uncharacterized protein n=1 Tax=Tanacetum coccineum TaxID=301880 RepID=A0ABQ5BMI4_9ASTR
MIFDYIRRIQQKRYGVSSPELHKKTRLTNSQYDVSLLFTYPSTESSEASPVKVDVPSELPKVSLVNASLKKLKFHLAQFDSVVKNRTTPDALTEGEWGFKHTKTVFINEIIPFLKSLKDIFNVFDKDLLNEIAEVQIVFDQMDVAFQQYSVDKRCLEITMKQVLNENDRLLNQIISQDIVNIVVNSSVDINDSVNVYSKLEQQCISLELAMQLNKENFQTNNTSVNQNKPTFDQLFELSNLKAELQEKDMTIKKLKAHIKRVNETYTSESMKKDIDEIETINIELEHRMAKLIVKNEHLKQTYKQLYDSIKPLMRYFSFGRHLDELHVTWAHLEKKRTRLRTYTNITQDNVISSWRRRHQYNMTPSQRRPRRRHGISRQCLRKPAFVCIDVDMSRET